MINDLNNLAAQYADSIWVRALHLEKWQWAMKDWRNGYFTGRQDAIKEVCDALKIDPLEAMKLMDHRQER